MKGTAALLSFLLLTGVALGDDARPPVRLAIVGLVDDHANEFLTLAKSHPEVQIIGIVETNQGVIATYAKQFGLASNLFHASLDEIAAGSSIDAVAAFTTTLDHRAVVEACAARHASVMMEKPLAVNMKEARTIEAAAKSSGIQIIVNYETTWNLANQAAWRLANEEHAIGELRKIVTYNGHRGPKEIGCSETFVTWLANPGLSGGGAMTDFGSGGANLITWLMGNQRPTSVMAVTQHIKPEIYPSVEDEGTIILTYPKAQGIVQASWNWPIDRTDLEIYGMTGSVLAPRKDLVRLQKTDAGETEINLPSPPPSSPSRDPLAYLVSVTRGETKPSGPSSLEINLVVTEILDAARESAATGRRIDLPPVAP